MRKTNRLKESKLNHLISESIKNVINEYVSMMHSSHNMDDFLDDDDFIEIVNRVVRKYGVEDFDENDSNYINHMEREIADMINDFVADEAVNDFGYKYGATNYRNVASNVIHYIQTHLNELY